MKRKDDKKESPEEYYWRVLYGKRDKMEWCSHIPVDLTTERAKEHKCFYCGNPNMEESMSGSECKRCGIKRLVEVCNYTQEEAEAEYARRAAAKERRIKFKEMVEGKKYETQN